MVYIISLPVFKQEALRWKNWCFCYLYMESLFFYLILMNSLGKSLSAKCIVLLCNFYHSYHEKGPNERNFVLFYFTSNMMHFLLLIILIGYGWAIKIFLVFCFLKGANILNFPIFGGHIEFLFFVRLWRVFFWEFIELRAACSMSTDFLS